MFGWDGSRVPECHPTGCRARLGHCGWPCCSSLSPVSAAKSGSRSFPCPPTVTPKTRKGCPGPSSHPGVGLRQARSPGPAGRRRAGARPALCRQLPALLCLTSAKRMKCIWTAGLAPTQRPPAGRLVCRPSSLDRAPGRPAPPAWPAGQLASAALGAQERGVSGRLSVCVAGAASPQLGPAVKLSGSACPHPCLSGLGAVCESVSPCLIAVGMSGSAFPPLSLCLAVWLSGSGSPTRLCLWHTVSPGRDPPHVSIASPCIRAQGSRRPAWPRPLLSHVALQTAAFPAPRPQRGGSAPRPHPPPARTWSPGTKAPSVSYSHTFLEEGKSAQIPASLWQYLSKTSETCIPQSSSLHIPVITRSGESLRCHRRGLAERAVGRGRWVLFVVLEGPLRVPTRPREHGGSGGSLLGEPRDGQRVCRMPLQLQREKGLCVCLCL